MESLFYGFRPLIFQGKVFPHLTSFATVGGKIVWATLMLLFVYYLMGRSMSPSVISKFHAATEKQYKEFEHLFHVTHVQSPGEDLMPCGLENQSVKPEPAKRMLMLVISHSQFHYFSCFWIVFESKFNFVESKFNFETF